MKVLKNNLWLAVCLLSAAVFFAGGYAIGNRRAKNTPPVHEAINTVSAGRIYYLSLEGGTLSLYRMSGGERELMASERITECIYPESDIIELKNGITFDNLSDAQLVFEDFVS